VKNFLGKFRPRTTRIRPTKLMMLAIGHFFSKCSFLFVKKKCGFKKPEKIERKKTFFLKPQKKNPLPHSKVAAFNILHFDFEASRISGKIYSSLKKKGMLTNLMDQMIAAIVISKNERLLTRNIKHYKNIGELRIEAW
jgi:tRNA(fMet)-specific endonuclease VapC